MYGKNEISNGIGFVVTSWKKEHIAMETITKQTSVVKIVVCGRPKRLMGSFNKGSDEK